MKTAKALEYAVGYYELGLPVLALNEISKIPPAHRHSFPVLQIHSTILIGQKKWRQALPVLETLCHRYPLVPANFLNRSVCLHQMHRVNEALEKLLASPKYLATWGLYHFHLACYECELGRLEDAKRFLRNAVTLDPRWRQQALHEKSLQPLRRFAEKHLFPPNDGFGKN